jgi:hypothetical protein
MSPTARSGADPAQSCRANHQKVGIQPNVLVRPTIAGVRSGKDEVLDRALAWLATGK